MVSLNVYAVLSASNLSNLSNLYNFREISVSKPSMREQMPQCAAFIDSLRDAFGKEHIDGQIRAGMRGEPVFYASENGHTLGTKPDQVHHAKD